MLNWSMQLDGACFRHRECLKQVEDVAARVGQLWWSATNKTNSRYVLAGKDLSISDEEFVLTQDPRYKNLCTCISQR